MKVNEYYRPSSLEDAYHKLQEDPKNTLLAGGLWIKKMGLSVNCLIDLSTLGLNKISEIILDYNLTDTLIIHLYTS